MKLYAHYLFSWGVTAFVFMKLAGAVASVLPSVLDPVSDVLTGINQAFSPSFLIFILFASFLANKMIDGLGHGMTPQGIPRRLPRTHSVFTAPIWGALAAVLVNWVMASVFFLGVQPYFLGATVIGAFLGYTHLFLDIWTEAGVYFTTKRVAWAHLPYNEVAWNALSALFGLLLVFLIYMGSLPLVI